MSELEPLVTLLREIDYYLAPSFTFYFSLTDIFLLYRYAPYTKVPDLLNLKPAQKEDKT